MNLEIGTAAARNSFLEIFVSEIIGSLQCTVQEKVTFLQQNTQIDRWNSLTVSDT